LAEVRQKDEAGRNMGINSVPTFIVAGQHAVPGAQPPDLWLRVIDDILE
jgi:predicted DsbA family dithiol-disulfide isomerase